MKIGVVVSGLPASGKTTVARELADRLHLNFLDKDDFLEDLYERHGVSSWDHRQRLSRESDVAFRNAATRLGSAVLVSHWRSRESEAESGTPIEWLDDEYDILIEVYCHCSADIAFERFTARKRHPGHFDEMRNPEDLKARLDALANDFPLGLAAMLRVQTYGDVDLDTLERDVRQAIAARR
ncbi:MAG: AAA family ATPase [Pseudomonadota bacterium]